VQQRLAAYKLNGEQVLVEVRHEHTDVVAVAIEGDRARACFTSDRAVHMRPTAQVRLNFDERGWRTWRRVTFVELARVPGGPWRLRQAFDPQQQA
jgi:hypothetical protein